MDILKNLKLVVLDDFTKISMFPSVRKFFIDTMDLKLSGYRDKYPQGVVPIDGTDFIARHYVVADTTKGELKPIMGYRALSLQQCYEHFWSFPLLGLAQMVNSPRHISLIQSAMNHSKDKRSKLSYTSCFTITPDLRGNKDLVKTLQDLMMVMHQFYMMEDTNPHEIFTVGVMRFKVHETFEKFGFIPLTDAEGQLPDMISPYLAGEKVRFLSTTKFNERLIELTQKYMSLWDNRIILDSNTLDSKPTLLPKAA